MTTSTLARLRYVIESGGSMADDERRPWLALYSPGVPAHLTPRWSNMVALWDATVARTPDAACLHHFDETLTFRQVDEDSDALAVALVEGGLARGDRVGIYLQNDPQWPITLLAVWKAGGIGVPLNPMFKAAELAGHLHDSGASVLVCQADLHRQVGNTDVARVITTHPADWLRGEVPALLRGWAGDKDVPAGTEDLRALVEAHRGRRVVRPPLGPGDVALLTYTSGTTGPPKGARTTHRNLVHNAEVYRVWPPLSEGDVVLGVAPLFHITGIVAGMAVAFTGLPLILFHRFDAGECLRLIERWRATFTVAAITVYIALLDSADLPTRDLSSFRKAVSGGAPVPPSIVQRFEEATGAYVHNIYGLTETTSPSHWVPFGVRAPVDEATGALSVGVPVCDCVVHVADLETGEPLPPGRTGELVIEGPMVVDGYWGRPEETERALPGGRLHTGDVGLMDGQGWFYLVDRAKDQINAAGYKVWPREVEDVLYQHGAVREAVVVGVPDAYRGETVKAFVVLTDGQAASPEELIAFCRARLAAYKYPRQVEIRDELPKTATGKFLRRALR
jgi:long-chain acyl-CoA synthetase